jgi:hypothetical protein
MALGAGCLLLSFRSLLRDQGGELIFLIAGLFLLSVGAALFLFAPYKQEEASTQDSSAKCDPGRLNTRHEGHDQVGDPS